MIRHGNIARLPRDLRAQLLCAAPENCRGVHAPRVPPTAPSRSEPTRATARRFTPPDANTIAIPLISGWFKLLAHDSGLPSYSFVCPHSLAAFPLFAFRFAASPSQGQSRPVKVDKNNPRMIRNLQKGSLPCRPRPAPSRLCALASWREKPAQPRLPTRRAGARRSNNAPNRSSALQPFIASTSIHFWRSPLPMNRRWGRGIHAASTFYGTGTCHAEAA